MNKIHLSGRMVVNPQLQTTQAGVPYCKFRIAVKRKFADKDGNKITDYFNVIAWRNQAEFVTNYFIKGKPIIVHGSMQNANYIDKSKVQHYADEVLADDIEFDDSAGSQGQRDPTPPAYTQNQQQNPYQTRQPNQYQEQEQENYPDYPQDYGDLPS